MFLFHKNQKLSEGPVEKHPPGGWADVCLGLVCGSVFSVQCSVFSVFRVFRVCASCDRIEQSKGVSSEGSLRLQALRAVL